MAFIRANFGPTGANSRPCKTIAAGALGVGNPQTFSYITEDVHATVDDANYFDEVRDLLNIGDMIDVVVVAAGALSTYGRHIVIDKSSTHVDTTNVTVGLMTDTN
jgi:hypothetical protein